MLATVKGICGFYGERFSFDGLVTWIAFLWYKVEPNQEFHGLVCEGASVLPTKFLQDAFRDGYGRFLLPWYPYIFRWMKSYFTDVFHWFLFLSLSCAGKIVNIRRLDEVISSINGWYMERGLFGMVSAFPTLTCFMSGILYVRLCFFYHRFQVWKSFLGVL